jgi:NCAIR mutase (PurE)-related protein
MDRRDRREASVVNIDNGFGAGYVASIINRL